MVLCMVAYIFSFIDRQIMALLIGPIQADMGISDTQFGLLHGFAFAIFYATMGIPIAALSDRTSRPLIIAAGVAFWSLATVACGFARGFAQLFAARVCVGAGEAALSPATYSLISDLFPREKLGRAVAVYSLGSFLGAGVAFLLGGWVIGAVSAGGVRSWMGMSFAAWQITFIIVGAPGILLALVMLALIGEPRAQTLGNGAAARAVPSVIDMARFLAREKAIFVPHMAGYTLAAMTLFSLLSWSPAYLMRVFALTPGESGLRLGWIAIFAAGGGVLASGALMDRLTRSGRTDAPFRAGIIGALGAIAPLALLPWASTVDQATVLLTAAFFFASFPMPPSTAVMQIVAPPTMRSRVSALFLGVNSLIGMGLSSALVGIANDHWSGGALGTGLSLAMVAGGAAILAVLVLSLGLAPFRRFVAAERPV
ncbi:MFStransporter [Sphingobium cupriresistens LL01]|uniref:MFStransporter n=1 Tax=Sphingobium cupriresistens LL01 TaxID=1420583 RepID=A0A0J7XKA6_9SPHN|nr:MFStransporter [Sphingobium cupriresistens LL01]